MTSMILGLASITCFGLVTGLPAVVLGALARRDAARIGESSPTSAASARGLALTGIVTGMLGTGISLVALVFALGGVIDALSAAPEDEVPVNVPVRVPITPGTHAYGTMEIVDLEEKRPLGPQLTELARNVAAKDRVLILQTYVRTSPECADIASAMPDVRMQRALGNVTFVRVDVDVFERELLAMRVDTETLPWFYKLDASAHIVDAISADEWDENTAPNMARVLADFADGSLGARRRQAPLGTAL